MSAESKTRLFVLLGLPNQQWDKQDTNERAGGVFTLPFRLALHSEVVD